MICLRLGPEEWMSPVAFILSHELCFLFDSWYGIDVDGPLASSHRNILIKSRNLIHRYSCGDWEMTVGSHILFDIGDFPDLYLLVKLTASKEKLWILCDRKGIDSVFVLKQRGHQSTLRSPSVCLAVWRLQDLIVACTLWLLHFFVQQHELVKLVWIDRGFHSSFKDIELQIESRAFIIVWSCFR